MADAVLSENVANNNGLELDKASAWFYFGRGRQQIGLKRPKSAWKGGCYAGQAYVFMREIRGGAVECAIRVPPLKKLIEYRKRE
ncbi:MAG: hypothetical protein ACRERR_06180 [Moraxellaceae bacterium]